MNIEKGQHVKYFLRNGMVLEGIVEEDTAAQVVLQALDGQSIMILHHPAEDIMMTKVVLTEQSPEIPEEQPQAEPTEMQEQIKGKLQEVHQMPEDPELQKKTIAELRQLVMEQERQIITQKRREHFGTAGNGKLTQYSSPYMPRRTVGRKIVYDQPRSAYQPGKLPPWVK